MKKTNKDFTNAYDESFLGFPIGKVAQSIRKVISPKFSNHDVESITIILVSHLMIEREINALLLKWMTDHLPEMSTKTKNDISVNDLAIEALEKVINKLDFVKKLNLIKPLGILLWGDDSKDIFSDFYKINDIRVEVAHRLNFEKVKIENFSIGSEEGVERFLNLAQQRLLNISDLMELIDS